MDPATLNIVLMVATAVGGYFLRYLQAKNNPNAPIIPSPAPVEPAEPKLGEGLILKLLLDMLKQLTLNQQQMQLMQAPMQEAVKAPEPVDVNELMRLLTKTLQTQPPA
jgi:hypothetical protein